MGEGDIELPDGPLSFVSQIAYDELREQAEGMAAGIRSFLSSLPYSAPESLAFQAKVKLGEPLAQFEELVAPDAG